MYPVYYVCNPLNKKVSILLRDVLPKGVLSNGSFMKWAYTIRFYRKGV